MKLRAIWSRLRGGAALSRKRVAASVALGLFVGCLPIFGLHFFICLAICLPFRLDFVGTYLAANISNPLSAPLLITTEAQVGSLILTGRFLTGDNFKVESLLDITGQLAVGSLVVATVLAVLGGALAYRFAKEPAVEDLTFLEAKERTVQRYQRAGRSDRGYVSIKLSVDPLSELLRKVSAKGEVLDIGCGRGQFSLLLFEMGRATSIRGVDWDKPKLAAARKAAGSVGTFDYADIAELKVEPADIILLIDVLHYLKRDQAKQLLTRAASATRQLLVVRELDRQSFLSRVGILFERIGTRLGVNRGSPPEPQGTQELARELEKLGLACRVESAGKLLGNRVIFARAGGTPS